MQNDEDELEAMQNDYNEDKEATQVPVGGGQG